MAKLSQKYESAVIISTKFDEDQTRAMVEKFSNLITKNGTLEKVDEWGKRKLAYLINDMSEGYYVLVKFQAPAELPLELERNFKISEQIMRYMVIREDD